jgi:general secretion pathway protein L
MTSADGLLANSLIASIDIKGELHIHTTQGQRLNTEETIESLKASRRLTTEIAIVWVPTQKVLVTEVFVPGKRKSHWLAGLPFALEEGLSEPVESYHFVPFNRDGEGMVSAAIVSHDDMQLWKKLLDTYELSHATLIPDCFRITEDDNLSFSQYEQSDGNSIQWGLSEVDGSLLVRTGIFQGFAANPEWYEVIKGQFLQNSHDSSKKTELVINEVKVPSKNLLASHSQYLPKLNKLSLSQFEYKNSATNKTAWYEWRWVTILALLLAVVYLSIQFIETKKLEKQAAYTQTKTTELFKKLFPNTKRIVNIKSQTLAYLATQANTTEDSSYLMPLLWKIEPWFNQVNTVKVEKLQWQANSKDHPLVLTVSAPSSADLQKLVSLAKKQSSKEKDGVSLKLTLKNVSATGAQGVIYVNAN